MDSTAFIIAAIAVVLIGFSKAGLGGGTGILATPLMILALGPKNALGVMLPLLILCDWLTCLVHRNHWEWQPVRKLLPATIIGIAAGTFFLDKLNGLWLERLIGLFCLAFCGLQWIKSSNFYSIRRVWKRSRHHLLGILTGLASTLAHAAGPFATMYLLPMNFSPRTFVATSVLAFTLINLLKLPTYFALGLIQQESIAVSLQLSLFIPVGILLGLFTLKRLNPAQFKKVIYVLVFITGLDLLSGKSLSQIFSSL